MSLFQKINIFHKNKNKETENESSVETGSINQAPRSLETDLELIRLMQEGGEISPEDLKEVTGMDPEEYLKYVTGDDQIKEADVKALNESFKSSLAELAQPIDHKSNPVKEFMRSQTGRIAFASLLLFLKFMPQAEAAEKKTPETSGKTFKTEVSAPTKATLEGGDKTFRFNSVPAPDQAHLEKSNLESSAELDLTNSYETDKADIPEAQEKEIRAQVSSFLEKINPQNFHDLMSHDWTMSGHSDERKTNNWAGGNYELTQARITAAESIVLDEIEKHDFSKSGLSEQQIKDIKEKNFQEKIFESQNGPEKGVKYITDLNNPETGQNYTEKEVNDLKKSDPEKYFKLLEECRAIKVNLMAKGEKIDPLTPGTFEIPDIETVPNLINTFGNYTEVVVAVDLTNSTKNNMEQFTQALIEKYGPQTEGVKIRVASYSDHVEKISEQMNMKEAASYILKLKSASGSVEKTIGCNLAIAEKLSPEVKAGETRLIVPITDEALQDVSYDKLMELKALEETKGIKSAYLLSHKIGNNTNEEVMSLVTLDDLEKNFLADGSRYTRLKAHLEKYVDNDKVSKKSRKAFRERLDNINQESFRVNELKVFSNNSERISMAEYD